MKKNTSRKLKKTFGSGYILIILVLFVVILIKYDFDVSKVEEEFKYKNPSMEDTTESIDNIEKNGKYEVLRVIDGDTILISYNGIKEKVRLIGIDTPESVHPDENRNVEFGKTASDYTKSKLEGKEVSLEFDVQERDKYGRLLAYVYLDGIMFNKTLLKEGYAKLATYPPNVKYVEEFTKIQEKARENKVGIWND